MTLPAEREILFARDLATLTGLSRSAVHRALRANAFGPCRKMRNGRLFVTRNDFEKALESMRLPEPEAERVPAELRPRPDLAAYFEERAGKKRAIPP